MEEAVEASCGFHLRVGRETESFSWPIAAFLCNATKKMCLAESSRSLPEAMPNCAKMACSSAELEESGQVPGGLPS